MYEFNDYFIIQIFNAAGKVLTDGKGGFLTTKKKHLGIGISNVKEVIKKYDGDIYLESKENLFIAKIIIPRPCC